MLSGHCHVEKDLLRQGHTKSDLNKSHTTIYMDDRSFCDSNIPRLLDRADAWLRWSTMTNLLENTKIQAVARTKQKQNQLADLRPEWTGQAETTILGITLTLERRRNSETEIKRIDKAKRRTKLLACLPLPWPNKLAVFKALVLPAVVYGWVCRKMPADDADHLHKALTRALHTNVMANSDIRKVVYGGTTHPLCVIKQRLFRRLGRLKKQKSVTWTNRAWTSTNLLRNYLADDNWTEVREWCWTNTSRVSLTLDAAENKTFHDPECHLLRQQWRLQCLQDWLQGQRHEARLWRETESIENIERQMLRIDLNWARHVLETACAPHRAVLLGSVVSPAWLSRSRGDSSECPWCSESFATLLHLFWDCPSHHGEITKPTNYLQARFGWPECNAHEDESWKILNHMANVVSQLWLARHGESHAVPTGTDN